MAFHLVARSPGRNGLAKILEQALRPAGFALLDSALKVGTATGSGQSQTAGKPEENSFCGMPALRLANASSCPAFWVTVPAQLRTFASAAVELVSTEDGKGDGSVESIPERSLNGSRDTAPRTLRKAKKVDSWGGSPSRINGQPDRGRESLDGKSSLKRSSLKRGRLLSGAAIADLIQQIREAPPDANLDALLADWKAGQMEIDGQTVQAVLFDLANNVKKFDQDAAFDEDETKSSSENACHLLYLSDRSHIFDNRKCSPEDARRALNLFEWWQRKYTVVPQLWLLNPLLKALMRGGLDAEIQAIWETYKESAKYEDQVVTNFLRTFFFREKYEEVLAAHKDMVDNKWPAVLKAGNDFVLRALLRKGAPTEEACHLYKQLVERAGQGLYSRKAFVDLLERGVSVEQIRSLEHREPDRVANRLIEVLCRLGRRNEAESIVKELLEREPPAMPLVKFVTILSTLVICGFKE